MSETFSKRERLCSRKAIEQLYRSPRHWVCYPWAVYWNFAEGGEAPVQVLIATSKRRFKHAVDRNRVKRVTRECYRRQKQELYDTLGNRHILLGLSYIGDELPVWDMATSKMQRLLQRLIKEVGE